MRQSQLFTKTLREAPAGEEALNAKLLIRGGFIYKNSAGVYSFLPLGWRVIRKISQIVREEMDAIGAQEMLMSALHDKHYLQASGRWDVGVVYKVISGEDKEPNFNISWTHEEVMSEIATKYVNSYRDLPFAAYQIQTKFRHEPRAKSGLLRGREFLMKDLYSFHVSDADLDIYYEKVATAYKRVFERCGLEAVYTLAAGGDFTTNYTHEFQVITDVGEDTIYICNSCGYAENEEVVAEKESGKCPKCGGGVRKEKAVEVGNIFRYGDKYSKAFNLQYKDEEGVARNVVSGAYGIGISRLMGVIAEQFHDENGLVWPEPVAPFKAHLIELSGATGSQIYQDLQAAGVDVLFDERELSAGAKFADADLLGIPWRLVVSAKTDGKVEVKRRGSEEAQLLTAEEVKKLLIG